MIAKFMTQAILPLLAAGGLQAAEIVFQEGFEEGIEGWYIRNSSGAKLSDDAFSGRKSLEIDDPSYQLQIEASGKKFSLRPGLYRISGRICIEEGFGPLILLDVFDGQRKKLGNPCLGFSSAPKKTGEWMPFSFDAAVPWSQTASGNLRIVSLKHVINQFRLDDLKVESLALDPVPPNWKAQYKNPEPGNPADFPGPDGIIYPNFHRAGVQGGIPDLRQWKSIRLSAEPDDDIAPAIHAAIRELGEEGGVIEIPEGRFHLRSLLRIRSDRIILRGAGRDKTRILFDYRLPEGGVEFYGLPEKEPLSPGSGFAVFAEPEGLVSIEVTLGGRQLRRWGRSMHSGNAFSLLVDLKKARDLAAGEYELKAVCRYGKGGQREKSVKVAFDPAGNWSGLSALPGGAIEFCGGGLTGKPGWIAADLPRGTQEIRLNSGHSFQKGDFVVVSAQETEERRKETLNTCRWGNFRTYMVQVTGVEKRTLKLDQPLRLEFPKRDKTSVRKIETIEGCGVQALTFESLSGLWLSGIFFRNAVNCFVSDVKVVTCGRHPVYFDYAKFCTVENSLFDRSRDLGVGGSGYVGFDCSWDCLMDQTETFGMRHAPLFQWSASGNVIRRSQFHNTDMHWHAGWTNENLVEECLIDARDYPVRDSGYGDAMYATGPEDGSHGPNGPRNVVYNCRIIGEKSGIRMGGMGENWIVVGNRFDCRDGSGISLKTMTFDTIIRQNVFLLRNSSEPMVTIGSPDCTGVELRDNLLVGGNGKFWGGLLPPAVDQGNRAVPFNMEISAPAPLVPSIYEYQKKHRQ